MPNHNHHSHHQLHHQHHLQQQVPTVNLKPVTSLHQVLYQNQQQQSQGNNCSFQGNNSKVNGHHLEFDMIKVHTALLPFEISSFSHFAKVIR